MVALPRYAVTGQLFSRQKIALRSDFHVKNRVDYVPEYNFGEAQCRFFRPAHKEVSREKSEVLLRENRFVILLENLGGTDRYKIDFHVAAASSGF
jgi:hypothetical protein